MVNDSFTALEIANFYIQLANNLHDDSVDNLKINKLVYYAQGYCLAVLGRPIFGDAIEAWEYGPVVPEVYRAFRCCGKNTIEEPEELFDEARLSSRELDVLINVYSDFGRYTGLALKDMTHQKGTPWEKCYEPGQNRIIPIEIMRDYFEKDRKFGCFEINESSVPVVTEIPLSWDSGEDNVYG